MAEIHQLNQALMSTGTFLFDSIHLGNDSMPFDSQLFACNISSAVSNSQLNAPLHCSCTLFCRGVKYGKDAFVVIDRNDTVIVFGKIILCIVSREG